MSIAPAGWAALAVAAALAGYGSYLWRRFRWRGLALLGLGFGVPTLFAYLLAWGWCLARPVYKVLYLQPDPVLGWKAVPSFDYVSTGEYGEFRVRRRTNAAGFQDREWTVGKPPGTFRIALLGDSLVEAIQVPWEKTAAQVLERRLNAEAAGRPGMARRYEVMNVGIGNYGLGQCLIAYEEHARRHRPDRVYVLVANFVMTRTFSPHLIAGGKSLVRENETLRVRPVFRIEGTRLVMDPPLDYAAAMRAQERVVSEVLGPDRSRLKTPGDHLGDLLGRLFPVPPLSGYPEVEARTFFGVNLAILGELARAVRDDGGMLTVLDISRFFLHGDPSTSVQLREFCAYAGCDVVEVSEGLKEEVDRGGIVQWPKDGHLTERGNELLAEIILDPARAPGQGRRAARPASSSYGTSER